MVLQDLEYVFTTLDIECKGYIEWIELQEFDEAIYQDSLDIEQLEAAIETVCGSSSNGKCHKEYFSDIAKELERRHAMEERIKWDFCALDLENIGRIPLETTLFLFKAIHNDRFSIKYWETFIENRRNPEADVCLEEVKLYLCNIPEYDVNCISDEDYVKGEQILKSKTNSKNYNAYIQLQGLQETEAYIAALEKEKEIQSSKIKNNADNLLNRMDEIGLHALLEDDFGDSQTYEGRPKHKVTATELLDALRDKYKILRDALLLQMLRNHIGEGMWQALPEHEQQEKLFQLKIKEEKIRKEGKLETMAIHLPGSRTSANYNVFSLMGESVPELEQRILDQQEKIRESGLPMEEVVREFGKKLNNKEKLNSSATLLLLDLNGRYLFEKDTITKKLQGLSGFRTLTASDREKIMFSFVQAILRGIQEKSFVSCALCIGLSERVQPRNHDRSVKDPEKNHNLSSYRIQSFKNRRSLDGPVFPPRLYHLKSNLGRVDLILQLLQECEHRFSLEREFLLSMMHSKQVLQHRISARKLIKSESEKQLSVLYAQWQGWRNKLSSEKLVLHSQNKNHLEEAVALKFELVKDEIRDEPNTVVISDHDASVSLLSSLQMKQDAKCQKLLNVHAMDKTELENHWMEQKTAIKEEWNDNIAAIIFGIIDISVEETELLDALQNKYDALKDKLLMQSLMDQYGKGEWDKLSEKERQKHLMQLKLQERKLRNEGKYDEISKLLGDFAQNSELLNKNLGENRENYMNQLNKRLRDRQRRIEAGEDPDTFEEGLLDDIPSKSSGNILKDLDKRFEDERDALLKKLREGDDRQNHERDRQAELMRLRLEARKVGREANFDSAALVLGLAERNKAALEDRLKSDRERQEQLAKERLELRRSRNNEVNEDFHRIEPQKDDISGWRDLSLKELALTHEKEYNLFADILQDTESEDLREEARELSVDERLERLNKLREKRNHLDLGAKTDQEQHMSIMEMAVAIKYVIWEENLKSTVDNDVYSDQVIISSMANLQEIQDEETRKTMDLLPGMSQEELVNFRNKQLQAQNEVHLVNACELVFKYEGSAAKDEDIVKALDKKYDTLLDKLALEALQKQMSEAEWKNLSEKERQARAMKIRLQQKQLMKEGRLDEAATLLGESFKSDANVRRLMGENKKKHEELLKERLEKRKKRSLNGEQVSDILDEDTLLQESEEEDELIEIISGKSLLADLQERYDDEKEALLARLEGADQKYMNEQERQAELTRLKREQRKAQKESRFDTAAMMLGLAERNKAEKDEKLSHDRARHELLAKNRLENLRSKRASKVTENAVSLDEEEIKDEPDIHNALMKLIEKRQIMEQEELVQYLQDIDDSLHEKALLMTRDARNSELSRLKITVKQTADFKNIIHEMAALKLINRLEALQSSGKEQLITNDDGIISIMADLEERQNEEDEEMIIKLKTTTQEEIQILQKQEFEYISSKQFPQLANVLGSPDETKSADTDALVGALDTKYDALKDKLILEALEKQMGEAEWADMNEKERQQKLLRIKLEQKKLKREGKVDEASRILNELLQNDTNVQSLLGLSKAEQESRFREKLSKRKLLKASGMTDKEIEMQEAREDQELEVELAKTSTGNVLLDLEKNYEAEKDSLLNSLKDVDSKLVNERRRQLELARLRREAKKIQAEQKFDTAAMVLRTAKSQQAALDARMKSDRLRQEKLAQERLEARRNKKSSAHQDLKDMVPHEEDSNDPITLHGNLLNAMERIHSSERDLLMELTQEEDIDSRKKASTLSSEQRQKRLFVLRELRNNWRESPENSSDQIDIFHEAMSLKLEESDMKDGDVFIKLLADLQDCQDFEAESTMKDLTEKDADTLKQLIQIQRTALEKQFYDNISAVLLDTKKLESNFEENDIEDELTDALKEKYDALKEKIYEEALKGKFDKDTWDAMTIKEKEEHIANMKANDQFNTNEEETINNLEAVILPSMDNQGANKMADVRNGIDILKDLEKQFEDEKDALLASFRNVDKKETNERDRQMAIALLRRDKMRIKREEKYNGAALLFNIAKQNEVEKEKSYGNERLRQEQLARERISARQKKRKEKLETEEIGAKNEIETLKDEDDDNKKRDLITMEKIQREGTIALRESVVMEMEEKHYAEQDKLYEMIQLTSPDKLIEASHLEPDEQNTKLNILSISRNKLREQCRVFIDSQVPESMNDGEKTMFEKSLSKERCVQSDVISNALVFTLVIKTSNLAKSIERGILDDEIRVGLMADLQELQSMENNALVDALKECDTEMLECLKKEQRKSRHAGYLDNLASVVFGDNNKKKKERESDMEELKEEAKKIESEAADQLVQLEKEIEEKRKQLPTMSGDEMEKFMKELQQQEEAKRQAIHDQIAKQREIAKQRLLQKQKKRDAKFQETEFVNAMIVNAQKTTEIMREKTMAMQGTQKDILAERLQRRRDDRKRKQEEAKQMELLAQEVEKQLEDKQEDEDVAKTTQGVSSAVNDGADLTPKPEVKKKKVMPPLPGGGMKREKTVVERASVIPENKKQEMINMLMREQTSLAMKISSEQSRQEEQVRLLREKRRKKMEARETEAAAVLGLGQRQKTMVEQHQKGERERQIGQIRDRVNRIKQERSSANSIKEEDEEDLNKSIEE